MQGFPDPCGVDLAEAVRLGADLKTVVPHDFVVVRGGTKPLPPAGTVFSATVGPTLESAAAAVPYGKVRQTTAALIRQRGGRVDWAPEFSPHGTLNEQHVHVVEVGPTSFSEPIANPVPRHLRIDAGN
jgi:hypothetical protein